MKTKIYNLGTYTGTATNQVFNLSFLVPDNAKKIEVLAFTNFSTAAREAHLNLVGNNRSSLIFSFAPIPYKPQISAITARQKPKAFFSAITKSNNNLKIEVLAAAGKLLKGNLFLAGAVGANHKTQIIIKIYE